MGLIAIDYRDRKLIYEQLVDNIKELVVRGDLKKDEYLPSVRSLAKELGINPNTIQKAYSELERQGIIATMQGRGSMIVKDRRDVAGDGLNEIRGAMAALAARAASLGVGSEDFLHAAAECYREAAAHSEEGEEKHAAN